MSELTARHLQTGETIAAGSERFEIIRLLGQGGMATVYLARQLQFDRLVALKTVHVDSEHTSETVTRLREEAKKTARLAHPNIVRIHAFAISDNGIPLLAMEYVDGKPLSDMLDKPLPPDMFFILFEQVLSALKAAHDAGIVHRDVKPSNILVTADGTARLMDFGIAKHTLATASSQALTKTGALMGSPAYMSPEQCRGEKVDARSDLYSVGCVMFEALTGRSAFSGETPVEVMLKHVNEQAPELPPQFNDKLILLVHQALATSPDDRFHNAAEMLERLNECRALPLTETRRRQPPKHRAKTTKRSASNNSRPVLKRIIPILMVMAVAALVSLAAVVVLIHESSPNAVQSPGPVDAKSALNSIRKLRDEEMADTARFEELRAQQIKLAEQGIELAKQNHESSLLPDLYFELGTAQSYVSYEHSKQAFDQALEAGNERDGEWHAACLRAYAQMADQWKHHEVAVPLLQKSLIDIRRAAGVGSGERALTYVSLSMSLCQLNRTQEALDAIREGERLAVTDDTKCVVWQQEASVLSRQGHHKEAERMLVKSTSLIEQVLNDNTVLEHDYICSQASQMNNDLRNIRMSKRDYAGSLAAMEACVNWELRKQKPDLDLLRTFYVSLAENFEKCNEREQAKQALAKALALADKPWYSKATAGGFYCNAAQIEFWLGDRKATRAHTQRSIDCLLATPNADQAVLLWDYLMLFHLSQVDAKFAQVAREGAECEKIACSEQLGYDEKGRALVLSDIAAGYLKASSFNDAEHALTRAMDYAEHSDMSPEQRDAIKKQLDAAKTGLQSSRKPL